MGMGNSVNSVPGRNIYGSLGGATLGQFSTANTPYDTATMGPQAGAMTTDGGVQTTADASAAAVVARGGFLGQPMTWWLVLVVMLVALKFIAQKLGDGEEFKSIRVSIHNVLIVSLSAVIGIAFLKVVFNKWKVPGLTTIINAV